MASTLRALPQLVQARPALRWGALVILCLGVGAVAGVVSVAASPYGGFAALAGLGLALAMLVNAQVGLITVIAIAYLLPFAVIPVPIGGVRLTFIDAALSSVLAVWVLRLLTRRDQGVITTPLDGIVVLFIGLAIASFILGIYSVSSEMLRFFVKTINSILFYFSVTNVVRTRRRLEQAVQALILAGFAAAGLGLSFYLLDASTAIRWLSSLRGLGYPSGPGVLRYIAGTDTLRATGTAIDPNVLGGMLLLALPLILSQLFAERALLPRRLLAPTLAMVGLSLVFTFSRGAWVGAVAAMLFLATLRYRRVWLLLIAIGLVVWALPQGEIVVGRLQSGLTLEDRAAQMRLGEYRDALRLISLYPWFGVGFGAAPRIDLYVAASSVYLLMAEEMGLVGLSAFLLAMAVLFLYALRSRRHLTDPVLASIQMGALSGVVGALTAGLFDHYFFNLYFPHTVALFWLFVGLTVVATRLGRGSEPFE